MLPSRLTLTAAGLMALTVGIHVFLGGQGVHLPLLAAVPDVGLAAFISVLWHAVTVVLIVLTIGLFRLAYHPDRSLEAVLSAIQLGFAALFLFYGATRLGTIWPMPQWVIFIGIPVLTRFGQRHSSHR